MTSIIHLSVPELTVSCPPSGILPGFFQDLRLSFRELICKKAQLTVSDLR